MMLGRSLNWDIQTCATVGPNALLWGDYHFALDLADALERLDQRVRVLRWGDDATHDADVVVHVRGNRRLPVRIGAINLLWVISHPEDVHANELLDNYDRIFAASPAWAEDVSRRWGVDVQPLLQAVNSRRFSPDAALSGDTHGASGRLLMVANARSGGRAVVRDAIAIGARPLVYGENWQDVVPPELIGGRYLPNEDLPAAYRAARIVLNDHWPDMLRWGFISNRLFEATAMATPVISDAIGGLVETFGALSRPYHDLESLRAAISSPWGTFDERLDTARAVRESHSFDRRALELMKVALCSTRAGPERNTPC